MASATPGTITGAPSAPASTPFPPAGPVATATALATVGSAQDLAASTGVLVAAGPAGTGTDTGAGTSSAGTGTAPGASTTTPGGAPATRAAVATTAAAAAAGANTTSSPASGRALGADTGTASPAVTTASTGATTATTTTTTTTTPLSPSAVPFAVPPVAPTAPAPATVPTPAAAPPSTPAPLTQQLARPLFSLAAAGPGTHVVTVTVSPEALGPVTVRAHVAGQGMHVEMFAPSDAAREAVRAILPDLRRDLGGAGLQASVDLSNQNRPSDQRSDQQAAGTPGDPRDQQGRARRVELEPDRLRAGALAAAAGAGGLHRASSSSTASIDVLA
ncbi:flagellar hook-length control protein FliK [Frigoribacterium faeni]|uniref:flagellar hook-length control protein FliK n=1 Tax=Frigoribacterium faeni TaxID=145483 RepID=UPI00141B5F52|nr:flagellar hook-length control protein FliK [Frigoribacterium faeni]